MNQIRIGEIFELYGFIPVVVRSKDPNSQTIKLIYKGGTTKAIYTGAFLDMAIRKIGQKKPQFALSKYIIHRDETNWAN